MDFRMLGPEDSQTLERADAVARVLGVTPVVARSIGEQQ